MQSPQALLKKKHNLEIITEYDEETFAFGKKFASLLDNGAVVAFFGDLGAGKTTLIKGLASALFDRPFGNTKSIFTYLHIYKGSATVHHFDLYRLENAADFLNRGLDEFLGCNGLTCIEWSERITPILPETCIHVSIKALNDKTRMISIKGYFNG